MFVDCLLIVHTYTQLSVSLNVHSCKIQQMGRFLYQGLWWGQRQPTPATVVLSLRGSQHGSAWGLVNGLDKLQHVDVSILSSRSALGACKSWPILVVENFPLHLIHMHTGITECPQLQNPANGQVSVSGTTVGSTATYTCNSGFVIEGESTRQCLGSGQWSGQAPTCARE